MKSAVLLIVFNRPDNARQVFKQIKEARPPRLYIAADGPRPDRLDDMEKCLECRRLAEKVDWPCEVHTLFRDRNVGCARGVSEGISWAFENENELIILEDDCVPAISFFSFCDEMLELYKNDTRVWQVCGRSHHPGTKFFDRSDYIFSRYSHIWGWATWKRCWSEYDLYMSDFLDFISIGGLLNTSPNKWVGKKENDMFSRIYREICEVELYHTWDYQWGYIKHKNNGLGIVPKYNLIRNIGVDGTHYSNGDPDSLPLGEMPSHLRHPMFVMPIKEYDIFHARHILFPRRNILILVGGKILRMIRKLLSIN